jgi:HNH endonuclease
MISRETVAQLLDYDPATGEFRWKVRRGGMELGSIAGALDSEGNLVIRIKRRGYMAHRLAWLLVHGRWPARKIRHLNGIKDDNRFANLREALS